MSLKSGETFMAVVYKRIGKCRMDLYPGMMSTAGCSGGEGGAKGARRAGLRPPLRAGHNPLLGTNEKEVLPAARHTGGAESRSRSVSRARHTL